MDIEREGEQHSFDGQRGFAIRKELFGKPEQAVEKTESSALFFTPSPRKKALTQTISTIQSIKCERKCFEDLQFPPKSNITSSFSRPMDQSLKQIKLIANKDEGSLQSETEFKIINVKYFELS